MRHITGALLVAATVLGGAAGPAAGETVRPAFHEAAERLWHDMADQIRGLGAQLDRHLRGLPGGPALVERPLISLMLDHGAELGLTRDQVGRLEALRADFAREAVRREADIRVLEIDLARLLDADPLDLGQVEAKTRELAQRQAELRIARLHTVEQGRQVLTPEQRARLPQLFGHPPRRAAERPTRL